MDNAVTVLAVINNNNNYEIQIRRQNDASMNRSIVVEATYFHL